MLFASAGELVPVAMRALDAGVTLAVAGIHLSDIPRLDCAAELSRTSSYATSPLTLTPTARSSSGSRLPWRPARRRGASARGGRSGPRRPGRRPDHRRRRPHPGVDRTGAIRSGRSCLLVIRGWSRSVVARHCLESRPLLVLLHSAHVATPTPTSTAVTLVAPPWRSEAGGQPATEHRGPAKPYAVSGWPAAISISRLYFATRSPRPGAPDLICPQPVPTTRSAMNESTVSPERCDTIWAYPARWTHRPVQHLRHDHDLVTDMGGHRHLLHRARARAPLPSILAGVQRGEVGHDLMSAGDSGPRVVGHATSLCRKHPLDPVGKVFRLCDDVDAECNSGSNRSGGEPVDALV
jgi:hypothetical protein